MWAYVKNTQGGVHLDGGHVPPNASTTIEARVTGDMLELVVNGTLRNTSTWTGKRQQSSMFTPRLHYRQSRSIQLELGMCNLF